MKQPGFPRPESVRVSEQNRHFTDQKSIFIRMSTVEFCPRKMRKLILLRMSGSLLVTWAGSVAFLFFPPLAPIFTHEYLARPKYRIVGVTYWVSFSFHLRARRSSTLGCTG